MDVDASGNAANSLGTLESCNAIGAIGGTMEIDVVVTGVPPYDPVSGKGGLIGFQFNLLYDPAVVNVVAADSNMMLAASTGSIILDLNDPLPDNDGDWLAAAADLGSGGQESGDGVLTRITLEAVGEGVSGLQAGGAIIVDGASTGYSLSDILGAEIVVGGSCIDNDSDNFTNTEEAFVGTDAVDACPDNETDDAWPADMVGASGYGSHDGTVNVLDIVQLTPPVFGAFPPDPNYLARKDFNGDMIINVLDIVRLTPPVFGESCIP